MWKWIQCCTTLASMTHSYEYKLTWVVKAQVILRLLSIVCHTPQITTSMSCKINVITTIVTITITSIGKVMLIIVIIITINQLDMLAMITAVKQPALIILLVALNDSYHLVHTAEMSCGNAWQINNHVNNIIVVSIIVILTQLHLK